jgi:hypothetical protein
LFAAELAGEDYVFFCPVMNLPAMGAAHFGIREPGRLEQLFFDCLPGGGEFSSAWASDQDAFNNPRIRIFLRCSGRKIRVHKLN